MSFNISTFHLKSKTAIAALAFIASLWSAPIWAQINWVNYSKSIDEVLTTPDMLNADKCNFIVLQSANDFKIVSMAGIYGAEATLTPASDIMYVTKNFDGSYTFGSMQDQDGKTKLSDLKANKLSAATDGAAQYTSSTNIDIYLDREGVNKYDIAQWNAETVSGNSFRLYMNLITGSTTTTATNFNTWNGTAIDYTQKTDANGAYNFEYARVEIDGTSYIRLRKKYVNSIPVDVFYNNVTDESTTTLDNLTTVDLSDKTQKWYLCRRKEDYDLRGDVLTLKPSQSDAEEFIIVTEESRNNAIANEAGKDEIDMSNFVLDNAFVRNHYYVKKWQFTNPDYKDADGVHQMNSIQWKWVDKNNTQGTIYDDYALGRIPIVALADGNGNWYNMCEETTALKYPRPTHSVAYDAHSRDRTHDWGYYGTAEIGEGDANTMKQTIDNLPAGAYKIVFQGAKIGGDAKFFANGSTDQGEVSVDLDEMSEADKTAYNQYIKDLQPVFKQFENSNNGDALGKMNAAKNGDETHDAQIDADIAALQAYVLKNRTAWGEQNNGSDDDKKYQYFYSQYAAGYVRDNAAAGKMFANKDYTSGTGDWVNDDFSKYSITLGVNVKATDTENHTGSLTLGMIKGAAGKAFVDNIQLIYMGDKGFHIDGTAALGDDNGETAKTKGEWRPYKFTNTMMYYRRSMKKGAWNAITLPVDLTAKQVKQLGGAGVKLSELAGIYPETGTRIDFNTINLDGNQDEVVLHKDRCYVIYMARDPQIPAGKKVSYRDGMNEGDDYFVNGPVYMINGVTQEEYSNVETEEKTIETKSSDNSKTYKLKYQSYYLLHEGGLPAESYVLLQGTMYYLSATKAPSAYVEATSWRLTDVDGSLGGAKEFVFDGIGDTNGITAIYGIGMDEEMETRGNGRQGIYNLQGQRVSAPQKGKIYIVNGKKVVY